MATSMNGFDGRDFGCPGGQAHGKAMWGGQFFGPNKAEADSMAAETEFPTTAAGTFGAHCSWAIPMTRSESSAPSAAWKAE